MRKTKVLTGKEARDILLRGAEQISSLAAATLGAKGKFVVYETLSPQGITYPAATKDGATAMSQHMPKDNILRQGALMVQRAAMQTDMMVGDSTTLTAILTHAIAKYAIEYMEETGVSSRAVVDELTSVIESCCTMIDHYAVDGAKFIHSIAMTASNGDAVIAKHVSDIYERIGVKGHVDIVKGSSPRVDIKYIDGIKISDGLVSPHFINNYQKGICELVNPFIIITDTQLYNSSQLRPLFKQMTALLSKDKEASVLLIVKDIGAEAMGAVIANNLKEDSPWYKRICVIASDKKGQYSGSILHDVASAVGCKFLTEESGLTINELNNTYVGRAGRIEANRDYSIIYDVPNKLNLNDLETRISTLDEGVEKEELQERYDALSGKVAQITIGGETDIETTEIIHRYEDAFGAVRSSLQGGVVPGGGTMLPYVSKDKHLWVQKFMSEPFYILCSNAGIECNIPDDYGYGINVLTGNIEVMLDSGIVDSAKAIITALKNAGSTAKVIINTEKLVVTD